MARTVKDFNEDWLFCKIADRQGYGQGLIDSVWEKINLPHTWNLIKEYSIKNLQKTDKKNYDGGQGIYRKVYVFDTLTYFKKHVYIEFAGANMITTLYINGKMVGVHKGGYAKFRFEITQYIRYEEETIVEVFVNNSRSLEVAPLWEEGDFTKFGGIYRTVSLIVVEDLHVDLDDYGSDGVYISYDVDDYSYYSPCVAFSVKVNLTNKRKQMASPKVNVIVLDASGNPVTENHVECTIEQENVKSVTISDKIKNVHLWQGKDNSYLYRFKIEILENGQQIDTICVTTGFRTCEIKENSFYLNHKKYNIYGINYNQDSYENDWAMTNEQRDSDYDMMEELGVTAVRMAHYQHDSYEYELCDKKGFLVWSEIPLINHTKINEHKVHWQEFSKNIKQQMTELIRQNYNHPSVIFWGLSNELYDTDEETCQLYEELYQIVQKEDDSRYTIYADNQGTAEIIARSKKVDLVGFNRYDGWYYTHCGEMCSWIEKVIAKSGKNPCISEYGAGGAVTQHIEQPKQEDIEANGDMHYEEYQSSYHEKNWVDIVTSQNVWGSFIWCMFDFASYERNEGDTVGENDKGLVTRDRKVRKDAFYFYQSVWNVTPMVHITGSRFLKRPKIVPEIKIYSNASKIELFVNEKSVGVQNASELKYFQKTIFMFYDIEIKENEKNVIRALAWFLDGEKLEDNVCWEGFL